MIDFHNHILPEADDGASSIKESIDMLKAAQSQGITDVVNTIHFQHPKMEGKNIDYKHICSIRDYLLKEMKKNKININIHLGAEVYFNFNLLEITEHKITTMGNGKYMLVEFDVYRFPKNFDKHLYKLAISGVSPIIAHPERYKPIQEDISILQRLINSGCFIQLDAGSILGYFGKRCKKSSFEIINNNFCHIIGSDAHDNKKRNFCLAGAKKELESITDDSSVFFYENPFNVINGKMLNTEGVKINNKSFFDKIIGNFYNS